MTRKPVRSDRRISRGLYIDAVMDALSLVLKRDKGLRPVLGEALMTMSWYWMLGASPKQSDVDRLRTLLNGLFPEGTQDAGRRCETAPQLVPVPAGAIHASQ
jgi:hypothetical protein